jgi:PAS domain-containing protein
MIPFLMINSTLFNTEYLQIINSELAAQQHNLLFWVIDTNYRLLTYNKAAENYLFDNYAMAISAGESVLDLKFDVDLLKKWESLYNSVFQGESFVIHGSTIEKSKNIHINQQISITPLKNLQNDIVGLCCSVVDLSVKKQKNSAITEEKRLLALLNQFNKAILVFEPKSAINYEIKYVNNQFLKLTRFDADIIGQNLVHLIQPEQLSNVLKKYE